MKKLFLLLFIAHCSLSYVHPVYASYVLPYPSYMPGNKLYKISRVTDIIKTYWSFGSVSQLKVHRSLSDKYFVESKILFEYKQYSLAVNALVRSNIELERLPRIFEAVIKEKKEIHRIFTETKEDMTVQIQLLQQMKEIFPIQYSWEPENQQASVLKIGEEIDNAIFIRQSVLKRIP